MINLPTKEGKASFDTQLNDSTLMYVHSDKAINKQQDFLSIRLHSKLRFHLTIFVDRDAREIRYLVASTI